MRNWVDVGLYRVTVVFSLNLFIVLLMAADVRSENDLTSILRRNIYYNRDAVPTQDQGMPTLVKIQMYIEGMSSFRAQSMDFILDVYFQLSWIDERLSHNGTKRILVKDPNLFNLIWHPDLYFANARTADFHHVTSPNFLVWIYPNGTVFYDARISLTVICMLNLARYPLDSQMCTLRILSYAYDVEQLVIDWSSQGVMTNPEIRMPDMKLREIRPSLRNDSYATADFIVDRLLMHHVISSFIPQSLIVIISWIIGRQCSSWTSIAVNYNASYVKASDVFGNGCMAFVFAALIEFTIVNYCTRRKIHEHPREGYSLASQAKKMVERQHDMNRFKAQTTRLTMEGDEDQNGGYPQLITNGSSSSADNKSMQRSSINPLNNMSLLPITPFSRQLAARKLKEEQRALRIEENRKVAQIIDLQCRAWFPLAFVLFQTGFWVFYLILFPNDV
ncbi:hypothetical protein M3Y94_00433600 [Aphelenchoides besseyi]|nr:hypothetical protein M3Y94_00433600 [Aphelenchoides besseyi]